MSDSLAALHLPRVIGHRGAAAHAPENTLAGFRAARDLGAAWVEFDVRLTGDGRAILLHDDTLDRTTDGNGPAAGAALEKIAALDAGGWFDARFAGEPVPTLEEAIDLLAILGLGANIELKPHEGAEAETARTVCAIIEAAWPADLPPPLLSSFAPAALAAARETTPDFARGLLVERLDDAWRAQAESVGAVSLHCDHAGLTAARAREVRAAGYPLLAYTVNHAGRAEELYGWGVVALFSDAPDRLRVGASPG